MTGIEHREVQDLSKVRPGAGAALAAWGASLPLALLPPAALWIFGLVLVSPSGAFFALMVAVVSCVVHFASYLVTGLPLFLWKFREPDSLIWKLPLSLATGALCGMGVGFLLTAEGSEIPLGPLIFCGAYGLVTAVSAFHQRPRLTEPASTRPNPPAP